jgi:hypothetical protein
MLNALVSENFPLYRLCIKSFFAYKHLLKENYVEYKHIFVEVY